MQLPGYLAGTCRPVGVGWLPAPLAQGSVQPAALRSVTMAATVHTLPFVLGSVGPSGEESQEIPCPGRN